MKQNIPYLQYIEEANLSLGTIEKYYLYPGMEFRSELKWWPDAGVRPTLHEGIDICYYTDPEGVEYAVRPDFNVPVMADGQIFAICEDYLGHTLFLEHTFQPNPEKRRFLSIYAHMVPLPHLEVGDTLKAGQVIGCLADTTGRKNRMPAHLHLSLMDADRDISPEEFDWNLICYGEKADLLNPVDHINSKKIEYPEKNHWRERLGYN